MKFALSLILFAFLPPPAEPGMVRSIVSFGASVDAADNAPAIQAAHDSFRGRTVNTATGPVGVVLVPAAAKPWRVRQTVWLDLPNVELRGEGWGSRIEMAPALRHDVIRLGLRRAEPIEGGALTTEHRPDAFGKLDATACPKPGVRYGVRTRGDSWLQFHAGPLSVGGQARAGGYYSDLWGETDQLTLECLIDAPAGTLPPGAPIMGMGGASGWWRPRPLLVRSGPEPDTIEVVFCLSGDDALSLHLPHRRFTASIRDRGWPLRLCVQIDLRSGTVAAYGNGEQLPVTRSVNLDPAELQGRTFTPNEFDPFLVGAAGMRGPVGRDGTGIDLALYGLRLSRTARYRVGQPGEPQERLDGRPLNDVEAYFGNDAHTVGFLPLTERPGTDRTVSVRAGRAGFDCLASGLFLSCATAGGLYGSAIRDVAIDAGNGYGQAVSVGSVLNATIERVRAQYGFHGVGSLNWMASYMLDVRDCTLHGYDSPIYTFMALARGDRLDFRSNGRAAIRSVGSSGRWRDIFIAHATPVAQSFFRGHNGASYGGEHRFEDVRINFEDRRETLTDSVFYAETQAYCRSTLLDVRDVFLDFLGPECWLFDLQDVSAQSDAFRPATVKAEHIFTLDSRYAGEVRTTGPLWRGSVVGDFKRRRVEHTGRWGETVNVTVREPGGREPSRYEP
jgi:hypothetical protein